MNIDAADKTYQPPEERVNEQKKKDSPLSILLSGILFENPAFHRFVAADALVGRVFDEHELAEQTARREAVAAQRERARADEHHEIEEGGELFVRSFNRVMRRDG